jgi:hypothetical protein
MYKKYLVINHGDINTEIERFVELGADRTVLKELARVLQGGKL